MLSKIKALPALATIVSYLQSTSSIRKIGDFAFVAIILSLIGIVTGRVPLPQNFPVISSAWYVAITAVLIIIYLISNKYIEIKLPTKHTVRHMYEVSDRIQTTLTGRMYGADYRYIGLFLFHNGQHSLHNFSFIKFSLIAFSQSASTAMDIQALQNLPITTNLPMINALLDGVSFSAQVSPYSPVYNTHLKMGVNYYTASPVHSKNGQLTGFIIIGSYDKIPETNISEEIAKEIEPFL